MSDTERKCEVCGGPIRRTNRWKVCSRTAACRAEHFQRSGSHQGHYRNDMRLYRELRVQDRPAEMLLNALRGILVAIYPDKDDADCDSKSIFIDRALTIVQDLRTRLTRKSE